MNLKDEKGITAIDVTISIVLIAFFITIITVISGNIQKNNKNLSRETEALFYAVSTIENIKGQNFDILKNNEIQSIPELTNGYIQEKNGTDTPYYRKIIIQDYADKETGKQREILKIVTVQIEYKDDKKEKAITLSTIRTQNS